MFATSVLTVDFCSFGPASGGFWFESFSRDGESVAIAVGWMITFS